GELSYSKVRTMTRVATDDNEAILIKVAMCGTANHLVKLVRKYQRVDKNQEPIDKGDEYQQRKLDCYQDDEGMWVIRARLPQVEGGLMVKALEEIMRQKDRNASAEVPEGEQENAPAEASKEELNNVPVVEKANYSQKRADAMTEMAEHYIATATVDGENGGTQALAGHERCQVVLHLSVDSLKAEYDLKQEKEHEHSHKERGDNCNCAHHTPAHIGDQWISTANAIRFSSDASLYTVLEDNYGNVLNVGRRTRTVGPVLKRALDLRDSTCRFPGCCCNKYVDFHHIQHWGDHGETEPDNLIKLCRFHHRLLHKGHFNIHLQQQTEQNHGQKWIFKNADGEIIEPNPTLPMSGPTTGVGGFMEVEWPDINSQTAVPRWRGEPLDYPRALRDLFWCKYQKKVARH
ncbi:MAG: HNH endonuclease, partial [Psychrosphaera sp.]|nr:HNH endonuclease [Psychrosphaera sp.]